VFVVNKVDRPGADDARRDLEQMLDLSELSWAVGREGHRAEIVMTSAVDGTGNTELWDAIQRHRDYLRDGDGGRLEARRAARLHSQIRGYLERELAEAAQRALDGPDAAALIAAVRAGTTSPAGAAATLARRISRG
jgi:LAO/AO transport system kinase